MIHKRKCLFCNLGDFFSFFLFMCDFILVKSCPNFYIFMAFHRVLLSIEIQGVPLFYGQKSRIGIRIHCRSRSPKIRLPIPISNKKTFEIQSSDLKIAIAILFSDRDRRSCNTLVRGNSEYNLVGLEPLD